MQKSTKIILIVSGSILLLGTAGIVYANAQRKKKLKAEAGLTGNEPVAEPKREYQPSISGINENMVAQVGVHGPVVKHLQKLLNAYHKVRGYLSQNNEKYTLKPLIGEAAFQTLLIEDGSFGPKTAEAMKEYLGVTSSITEKQIRYFEALVQAWEDTPASDPAKNTDPVLMTRVGSLVAFGGLFSGII